MKTVKVLLVAGAINWGLVGVGMLVGNMADWNVIHMALRSVPVVEALVYILVGIAGVMKLFGCRCNKCVGGLCSVCGVEGKMEGGIR